METCKVPMKLNDKTGLYEIEGIKKVISLFDFKLEVFVHKPARLNDEGEVHYYMPGLAVTEYRSGRFIEWFDTDSKDLALDSATAMLCGKLKRPLGMLTFVDKLNEVIQFKNDNFGTSERFYSLDKFNK